LLAALRWREEGAGWRVDRVATRPEARGQGYGRWLATKVEALAIRKNVPFLLLSLPWADAGQLAYYERLGYRVSDEPSRNGAHQPPQRHLRKVVGGVWQRKATGAGGRSPGGSGRP
ncbi:MAG: GNAT family N-acetyltransferase, partial [Trueperaceae bacterium]|nr:GNAT family N-acetyltransferase [Trueperaceae bacterium]